MLVSISICAVLLQQQVGIPELGVAVFSKTTGFRHGSIEAGKQMFKLLASENAWILTLTEDAAELTKALPRVRVVVFLNTTGDVLDDSQQATFEKWFKKGNGFVGVHSAADTEYEWPWYGKTVGAYFRRHPAIQTANISIEDRSHPAMKHLPSVWRRADEWYDYKASPRGSVHVLASLDTASYAGHEMGGDHPIVWCQESGGGRAFYTGLGHTDESFTEKAFMQMIRAAVQWASGK